MNEMLQNLRKTHSDGIVEEHNILARLEEIRKHRTQLEGAIMALSELARQESSKPDPEPPPTDDLPIE